MLSDFLIFFLIIKEVDHQIIMYIAVQNVFSLKVITYFTSVGLFLFLNVQIYCCLPVIVYSLINALFNTWKCYGKWVGND